MPNYVAKLEIYKGSELVGELLLEQEAIKIGRAPDNSLILSDANISRYHAQIVCQGNSYTVLDSGSSTGTRVNNVELAPRAPHPLKDQDRIGIGMFEITFNLQQQTGSPASSSSLPRTVIAGASALPGTVALGASKPPILKVKTSNWVREFNLDADTLIIGRAPQCDIVIDSSVVSGRHAQLRRFPGGYEIFDLDSTNGLIDQGQQVRQKRLQDGDVLQISQEVTLIYELAPVTEVPVPVESLQLRGRNSLTVGRDPKNDAVIDHPAVSRFHAKIEKRQDGSWIIEDLGSSNGTFVGGKLIEGQRVLRAGDNIRIGPCSLILNVDETLVRQNEEGNLRLDAVKLNKIVGKDKDRKNLLNDISLSILAREFVVVAGVSGGGKSTLLDALNGFRPATSGQVLVNGVDLYKNFNAYRTELGYVPQKDIVHTELSVEQALDYAAQLRMPADTTTAERKKRVYEVLKDLGLDERGDVLIKSLSGGQLKRVSMGVELLTKPSLFFLDEATSGLDPGTEADIMKLLRKLADDGRTVLLITHATENVVLCDLVIFLAAGGRVAYFGPPDEAPQYFGVQKFNEIYPKVEKERSPEAWQQDFLKSQQYQKYVVGRQQSLGISQGQNNNHRSQKQGPAAKVKRVSALGQFLILSQRNLAILIRDKASLMLMLAVAPLIGFLDFFTWQRNIFDVQKGNASQAITMLFTTALIAVMVGSLSTMREIVKEVEIYRRERMIGLQILPYIFSKLWIAVLLAIYQAAVFLLFKKLAVDIPGGLDVLGNMYFTVLLATIGGMVMGLLVSAISPNQNVAPLLTILFLVPQITFGGGVLPVANLGAPGLLINHISITKWPFEALVTITDLGKDVAEDSCWQKSEDERKNLTDEEKKACKCFGSQLFKGCSFPGIKAKYEPEVDKAEPAKPVSPGDPPTDPLKLQEYQDRVKEYNKEIEKWQDEYGKWKEKNQGAIAAAEGIISRYNKDYGSMFKVNVTQHWLVSGLVMAVMFVILLIAQFWKDKAKV